MTKTFKTSEEALEASIEHWKQNAAVESVEDASVAGESCPLCQFHRTGLGSSGGCATCPVMQRTGRSNCHDTPYYRARDFYYEWSDNPTYDEVKNDFQAAAKEEILFLESLRKETENAPGRGKDASAKTIRCYAAPLLNSRSTQDENKPLSSVYMPKEAQILHLVARGDTLNIWALVPMYGAEIELRGFIAYRAGETVHPGDGRFYVGTAEDKGILWHVFELWGS